MFDILTIIPGRRKLTGSGWYNFNAVCCHHRGHRPDKKNRGGIIFDGQTNWIYNCFNCAFTCGFSLGQPIAGGTKTLLQWCGVDESQIFKWSIESIAQKDFVEFIAKPKNYNLNFSRRELPENSELIDETNPKHAKFVKYLHSRSMSVDEYPFMVTPDDEGRNANRIIIPYTYKNKIIGHTSRYLDNNSPRYINDQPPGYVFGYDLQQFNQSVCILVEGIFDALSINGCAVMHNEISDHQVLLLANLNRRIIFVPDRDEAGLILCDRALELGYSVSIPSWEDDIKDVNDATIRYGRLPTLLSIMQSATMNKIKIEIERNKIARNLQ